jgi:branched-chain amino acid transport system ATP-binding protein
MEPLLDVTGLHGGYTRAPILRNIELRVGKGEIVGLLGANGAGKTTLLRALTGTLPSCRGTVRLGDRIISGLRPWRRIRLGLALVPEGRHVFTAMTVTENLDVGGLAGRGATTTEDVFDLFPRLHERRQHAGGSLSGGEQQMLAIGRALMSDPTLLLIDEMSAGLAPVLIEQLVEGIGKLRQRGVAALMVEQSPHYVADLIDRAYLLEHGRVVREGALAELGGADAIAATYLGIA